MEGSGGVGAGRGLVRAGPPAGSGPPAGGGGPPAGPPACGGGRDPPAACYKYMENNRSQRTSHIIYNL